MLARQVSTGTSEGGREDMSRFITDTLHIMTTEEKILVLYKV